MAASYVCVSHLCEEERGQENTFCHKYYWNFTVINNDIAKEWTGFAHQDHVILSHVFGHLKPKICEIRVFLCSQVPNKATAGICPSFLGSNSNELTEYCSTEVGLDCGQLQETVQLSCRKLLTQVILNLVRTNIALLVTTLAIAKMQRFGFHTSNGSLIGLQNIYRYYGHEMADKVADYYHVNRKSPDPGGGDDGDEEKEHFSIYDLPKLLHRNGWISQPDLKDSSVGWLSEPDLWSKHPSQDSQNTWMASKESYHSLASLVNWQRILSDMTTVSPILIFFVERFLGYRCDKTLTFWPVFK